MNLKYATFFTIEILNDYYTDGICADFHVVPTEATNKLLSGFGMLSKVVSNKLVVLVRVDADGKPLMALEGLTKLVFYLKLQNSEFLNFSNLHSLTGAGLYYLSNVNQNKAGSASYLNSKPDLYDNAASYEPGDFALDASGDLFEAMLPSTSVAPKALTNANYWLKRGKVQNVNGKDVIELCSYVHKAHVPAATNFTIKVFGEDTSTGNYSVQVLDTVDLNTAQAQSEITLRMENLPFGKYRVEINGLSQFVYFDSTALYTDIFGIIEVSNLKPAANDFALIDDSGKPKETMFTVRFANRLLYWKYISRTSDITAVKDSRPLPEKYLFNAEGGNQFVSEKPLPFTEKPLTSLSIESTALGNISPVGNPGTQRLGTITKDGRTYYCAELRLNY